MRILPLLIAVVVLCTPHAFAQMNTGDITGVVTDPSGAAVEGASVDAVNVETQRKFESLTNGSGQYRLSQLPPGLYTLTANMQ
jgi:hypothetical protein